MPLPCLAMAVWLAPLAAIALAGLGIAALVYWRTQRRALLEELARQSDSLEARNRVKADFLHMVGHEIRTPLNGIVGMTTLLGKSPLDQEQRQMLDQIGRSAEHMARLVDDLLDMAWLESGRLDVSMGRVDLIEVAEDVVDDLAARARAKRLALDLHIALDAPRYVRADDVRLRRALRTLVENAIEFTETGTVLVRVHRGTDPLRARIAVVDTGSGMTPETVDRLLKARQSADDTDASRGGGPRLGVRVVRLLVEKMGGKLDVSSAVGSGSVFAFDLSVDETVTTDITERLAARALIASEDLASRKLLADHAERLGLRVDVLDKIADLPDRILRAVESADPYRVGFVEIGNAAASQAATSILRTALTRLGTTLPPLVAIAPRSAERTAFESLDWADDTVSRPVGPRRLESMARQCIAVREGAIERARSLRTQSGSECVLIAEDHETNRLVALGYVMHLGFRGRVVTSGRAAVEAIKASPDDVHAVILDAEMPDGNGLEATRAIRRWEAGTNRQPVPIIIVTAHAAKFYEGEALAAGANAYLRKPVRMEQLGRLLYRQLGRRRDRRSSEPGVRRSLLNGTGGLVLDPGILDDLRVLAAAGDKQFLRDLLESFRTSSARILQELGVALTSGDGEAARKLAHQIKGSSRTLGARELGDIFAEIEKDEDIARRKVAYERALREVPRALAAFEAFVSEVGAEPMAPAQADQGRLA